MHIFFPFFTILLTMWANNVLTGLIPHKFLTKQVKPFVMVLIVLNGILAAYVLSIAWVCMSGFPKVTDDKWILLVLNIMLNIGHYFLGSWLLGSWLWCKTKCPWRHMECGCRNLYSSSHRSISEVRHKWDGFGGSQSVYPSGVRMVEESFKWIVKNYVTYSKNGYCENGVANENVLYKSLVASSSVQASTNTI